MSTVRQLHREFVRAGADVIQAFTFSMDDDMGSSEAKHGVRRLLLHIYQFAVIWIDEALS